MMADVTDIPSAVRILEVGGGWRVVTTHHPPPSSHPLIPSFPHPPTGGSMTRRSEVLAARLEQGVRELTELAQSLNDEQWKTKIPHDGRTVGVVVHHVGTMYPIE